jgi:hypothetical protein
VKTLQAFGWNWRDNGADVYVRVGGKTYSVFVPIRTIHVAFDDSFARAGAPFPPTIGGCASVGGFFSSLKKAVRKVGKAAKRITRGAVKKVRRAARTVARRAYRGARGAARSAYRGVRALSRGNLKGALAHGMGSYIHSLDALDPSGISSRMARNPQVRQAMVAASAAFPATAPFAPAIAAANKAYTDYQRGRAAAQLIRRGRRHPALLRTVQRGLRARDGVASMARLAAQRDPRAMEIIGAFQQLGNTAGYASTLPGVMQGFW